MRVADASLFPPVPIDIANKPLFLTLFSLKNRNFFFLTDTAVYRDTRSIIGNKRRGAASPPP